MSPRFVLGRENVPCVAEVVNRSLKADYTDFNCKSKTKSSGTTHKMNTSSWLRLQLHGAIYRPDSFVLILRYCANLKAIRYESTSLNRILADKCHRVIVALDISN